MNRPFFIVVGPTASGKTSLVTYACRTLGIRKARTSTTRPVRPNEDESAYNFVSVDEFFATPHLEYTEYSGNYYGLSEFESRISDIVITDANGVEPVRSWCRKSERQAIVLVLECSEELLKQRMRVRGDSEADIESRIKFYRTVEKDALLHVSADMYIDASLDFSVVAENFIDIISRNL